MKMFPEIYKEYDFYFNLRILIQIDLEDTHGF